MIDRENIKYQIKAFIIIKRLLIIINILLVIIDDIGSVVFNLVVLQGFTCISSSFFEC